MNTEPSRQGEAMSAATHIQIRDLSVSYGDQPVLKNVSLDIDKGEIFALLGPNGAGKTTLINIICGIVTASAGNVTINNSGLLNMTAAATCLVGGAFNQTGSGAVHLANAMTVGGTVAFSSPATLTGATSINTSAANQSISFASTIDGANNLTLTLGSGNLSWKCNNAFWKFSFKIPRLPRLILKTG